MKTIDDTCDSCGDAEAVIESNGYNFCDPCSQGMEKIITLDIEEFLLEEGE